MSKVKIITDEKGQGTIIIDDVELKEVISYKVNQSVGELPKVNISVVPIMVMVTHQDAIVEYDFIVSPLPNDVLLKLKEKINEEIQKRGILE